MSLARLAQCRTMAIVAAVTLLATLAPLASPASVAAAVLAPPTLTSPVSGDTVTGNPVFAWTAVGNAAKYRVEVSIEADFSPLVSGFPVDTQTLRYAPPAELPLGTIYWRVAALDSGNVLGTYAYDSFIKGWGAAPSPLTPVDGAELSFPTDPLLFTWNALAGAQSYELQVDDAEDFIGASSYTTKNTSYVITEPRTVNQAFYWRVRGVSGALYSDWSPTAQFSSIWPTVPQLVYPGQDATGITDVYFDWQPVLGAKTYQLQVSPNGDWANNRTIDVTVKSTRYAPPVPLNNGNYFWRVRAVDAASSPNYGPWTDNEGVTGDERVFQRGWADVPSLEAPADTATLTYPTWTWTPAEHSSWYRLRISTDPSMDTSIGTVWGCLTNRTTYTPYLTRTGTALKDPGGCTNPALVPGNTYYWDVAGLDSPVQNPTAVDIWGPPSQTSSIAGLRSAVHSFVWQPTAPSVGSVRPLDPEDYLTPAACDPADCAVFEADTPTFTWTAIPGALSYTVTVALDPNFTNVYRIYTTANNRLAPRDSWRDNQANQAYYWNVRPNGIALDVNNRSVFQKRTEGVHRTLPLADSEQPNDFTFTWQDYLDTNLGLTPAIPQEAQEYRIQVSTVSDFATLVETKIVNTPFYTPYDKTYAEGPIYWRVQAIDGSDNDLTVSRVGGGSVLKKSPVPDLTYPDDGDTVLGVPYLQWDPLAYAASYDVQLDNDDNFSSPISTVTTKMTAWAYTEPLASGVYHWRVRRNDADNRDGGWSAARSFVLTPAAPTLVSPTNGANPAASTLVLQWTSSQPAPKYTVEVSASAAFTSQVTGFPQTTVMTSWAPKALLANGTYYWRVKALNAGGTAVASSSTFSFTIDSSRPTVAAVSPSAAAAITSPFTVTFSEPVTGVGDASFVVKVSGTTPAIAGAVSVLSPTSARFTPASPLIPGQTYAISLTSAITDLQGNPLIPYAVNVRAATTIQQDSVAVKESWGRWAKSSASGGAMKLSRTRSTKLSLAFTGASIALVGYRGPTGGYASLYLDGALMTSSLSFYASSGQYQRTLWSRSGLTAGPHTLEVLPRGSKPSASSDTWVFVDAFLVDGTPVQETGPGVTERFRRVATTSASASAYEVTSHRAATGRTGATLTLQFKGTGISWYGTKGRSYGKAYVYIDGVNKGTVDLYRSSTAYRQRIWTSTTLSNGVHTLKVLVVGKKRSTSKGYDVSFDYFSIK